MKESNSNKIIFSSSMIKPVKKIKQTIVASRNSVLRIPTYENVTALKVLYDLQSVHYKMSTKYALDILVNSYKNSSYCCHKITLLLYSTVKGP